MSNKMRTKSKFRITIKWISLALIFSFPLLFYFMPGMPPRMGEWHGNIQVDLHSGEVSNTVKLGSQRNGHYKYKWHFAQLGEPDEVDNINPMQLFTTNAQIGDKISGSIIIKDDENVVHWRENFDVEIIGVESRDGNDSYTGPAWFGNDIRIKIKIARSKSLRAEITVNKIDHNAFTDGLGFKVSLFGSQPCRHIECLLD